MTTSVMTPSVTTGFGALLCRGIPCPPPTHTLHPDPFTPPPPTHVFAAAPSPAGPTPPREAGRVQQVEIHSSNMFTQWRFAGRAPQTERAARDGSRPELTRARKPPDIHRSSIFTHQRFASGRSRSAPSLFAPPHHRLLAHAAPHLFPHARQATDAAIRSHPPRWYACCSASVSRPHTRTCRKQGVSPV